MIPILMHQMRISTNQVFSVILGPTKIDDPKKKYVKTVREPKKNKYCVMKLSQIRCLIINIKFRKIFLIGVKRPQFIPKNALIFLLKNVPKMP
jgi:hypothetical protein